MGLLAHRLYIVLIVPVAWALATVAYIVTAPLSAAETVWVNGIKKHWNDQ